MNIHVTPGTLLLSAPNLLDPNFMHTVVMMCQHDEDGAFGVVVNRPSDVTIDQLLPEHPVLGRARHQVHSGGPVGLDKLQVLHRIPRNVTGGSEVAPGVFLGGDLDDAARLVDDVDGSSPDLRFVVGYSGWSGGQLDAELATGSWVPAPFDVDAVFSETSGEETWRRVLKGLGDEGEGLSLQPPDPSWN